MVEEETGRHGPEASPLADHQNITGAVPSLGTLLEEEEHWGPRDVTGLVPSLASLIQEEEEQELQYQQQQHQAVVEEEEGKGTAAVSPAGPVDEAPVSPMLSPIPALEDPEDATFGTEARARG